MPKSYYSCPSCHKEISDYFDTPNSMWLTGWGSFFKERCQYCGEKVMINWPGVLTAAFLNISIIILIYCGGLLVAERIPKHLETFFGVVAFGAFLPVFIIIFYVILPLTLNILGVRFYKKSDA